MNLGQLRSLCQAQTGFDGNNFDSNWNAFINEGIREHARVHPWIDLEDNLETTTDTTPYLILPNYVDSIVSILNTVTQIPVQRAGDWDRQNPMTYSQRTTGAVFEYDRIGAVATLKDPGGYVYLQSTSQSDAFGSVWITGYANNSGASGTALQKTLTTLTVTPTGTSPVTFSTQFQQIISISKTTDTNGDFYFYDAGATGGSFAHISFIDRYSDEAAFKRLHFLYVPASPTPLRIRFRHKIPPLKNDTQSPHPSVTPDFVVAYAVKRFWERQQQFSKAQAKESESVRILDKEANKDENFSEPHSRITPRQPDSPDNVNFWFLD